MKRREESFINTLITQKAVKITSEKYPYGLRTIVYMVLTVV